MMAFSAMRMDVHDAYIEDRGILLMLKVLMVLGSLKIVRNMHVHCKFVATLHDLICMVILATCKSAQLSMFIRLVQDSKRL